jgi:hypothetical protein
MSFLAALGQFCFFLVDLATAALRHGIPWRAVLAEAYKIAALDAWNRMPRRQPSVAAHDDAMAALERFANAARRG